MSLAIDWYSFAVVVWLAYPNRPGPGIRLHFVCSLVISFLVPILPAKVVAERTPRAHSECERDGKRTQMAHTSTSIKMIVYSHTHALNRVSSGGHKKTLDRILSAGRVFEVATPMHGLKTQKQALRHSHITSIAHIHSAT